jgi:putative flavoprotein involved in K+ transport
MHDVSVAVIGAGPAGLAMSAHLVADGIDHVVLEKGEVASSWRNERWDSLRLLTPNWMTELPGQPYNGRDPDGFMTAADTVALLERYRERVAPPS